MSSSRNTVVPHPPGASHAASGLDGNTTISYYIGVCIGIVRVDETMRERAAGLLLEYRASLGAPLSRDYTLAAIDRHIASPRCAMWVARAPADLCACLLVHPMGEGGCFELRHLYVRRAYRRRGIAAELMRTAEAFAKAEGAQALILDTKVWMAGAHQLYKAAGFEPLEGYVSDDPESIRMWKSIAR